VERRLGGVDHRGALLGPEESGLGPVRVLGLFLLGHGHTGSVVGGCGGWLGPALTKRLLVVLLRVGCFPCEVLHEGSGGGWAGCPARILRTV
jgi:hypothetical protein